MGWLFYDKTPANIEDEIRRLCTGHTPERSMAPVRMALVGSTWYVAVRVQYASPEEARRQISLFELQADNSFVFAAVILTQISGGWGYKDLDETVGPVESRAPAAILDLLSPTTDNWALEWRQRCRAKLMAA